MKFFKKATLASLLIVSSASTIAAVSNGQTFGKDWKATCEGNQCAIVQVVNNQEKNPVGRVILRKLPQAPDVATMIVTVPLGVNLQAGVGVGIDGKELVRIPYAFCDQGGCNALLPLEGDALAKVKAGKELQIAAFVADQQQTLGFSLNGVTAAINAL